MTADQIAAAARATAFDDAAAIIRRQHQYAGGIHLTTEAECLQASWTFSNAAYLTRQAAGLPQPDAAMDLDPASLERLRALVLPEGTILPAGHVQMPRSLEEAKGMVLIAEAYVVGQVEEFCRAEGRVSPSRIQRKMGLTMHGAEMYILAMVKRGTAREVDTCAWEMVT